MAKRKIKSPPSEALAPQTMPAEPGESGPSILVLPRRPAGVQVDEDTALTLGAVWACVRVISETSAVLPWGVFRRRRDGGRERQADHAVDWLLHMQANPETSAYHWRECLVAHALTWGNGYAEIERDNAGRPVWLWQLTPDRVEVDRTASGRIIYDVANPRETNTVLEARDVYHLKGLGFDGLVGYSVIRLAARSIGLGIALEESAANLSVNDSTPGGLLKYPGRLKPEARTNLRESWQRLHSGPNRRRTVAILEEGMDWQQTGLPPEDTQLVEQRQFTPADICRWFRVPPHKIGDLSRATFSNIEEQNIDFTTDTIMPWAVRLESEANIKLFGQVQRGLVFSKLNLNGLLRGNSEARSGLYTSLFDRGVFSINDILELEDRNPIGPDGDKRFVPVNMQLLEKAGEEPPAPAQEPDMPMQEDDGDAPEDDDTAQMRAAFLPMLEDVCRWALQRESHQIQNAAKKQGDDQEAKRRWADEFKTKHIDYLRKTLAPAVKALAALRGRPAAASLVLEMCLQRLGQDLDFRLVTPLPDLERYAGSQADWIFRQTIAACAALEGSGNA